MARRLRMESTSGVYHVLNRGNYRLDIFRLEKTKAAFLQCVDEACERTAWRVHAWCLMSNHYHLAISTPRANLVEGMRWLQGTFALRFNRFRGERGHLFQGRYKSLLVDPADGLGALCHYIHLNPVRAHLCAVTGLKRYRWTSMHWLCGHSRAPAWYDPLPALVHAGGLKNTAGDVQRYLQYLAWLAEDEPARKQQRFATMSQGWIIGGNQFTREAFKEHRELAGRGMQLAEALQLAREAIWAEALQEELQRFHHCREDLFNASKSADWKLQLALALKARTTVTNRWLGEHLRLGARDEVCRKLAVRRRQLGG